MSHNEILEMLSSSLLAYLSVTLLIVVATVCYSMLCYWLYFGGAI